MGEKQQKLVLFLLNMHNQMQKELSCSSGMAYLPTDWMIQCCQPSCLTHSRKTCPESYLFSLICTSLDQGSITSCLDYGIGLVPLLYLCTSVLYISSLSDHCTILIRIMSYACVIPSKASHLILSKAEPSSSTTRPHMMGAL